MAYLYFNFSDFNDFLEIKLTSIPFLMEVQRIILNLKAMFDILDDNLNLTNLSISPGSRSASMKKIQKKQNRPSLFQQSKPHNNQNKEFDDLISGFLDKQSKNNHFNSENVSRTTSKKDKFDSLDLNFDEISKFKQTTPISASVASTFGRPLTAKNYNDLDAVHEDHKFSNHFGMTQQTILNPSKIEESFVSTRQMKPPIKRRENVSYLSNNIFNSEIGMTIPEEDPTISNSSNDYPQSKPARSMNRRSSIDARSELNFDESFTLKNQTNASPMSFKDDKIKQEPLEKLSNTESHIIGWGHNDTGFKFGSNFAKNDISSNKTKQKPEKQEKTIVNGITQAEVNERINKNSKAIISDYQKQIQIIKANFQRQNDFLQESLDKQICQNREMREKFMKETGKMIDEERTRFKRIHQEEISRLKDMFQWQKKKITEAMRCEIESLKNIIDFKKQNSNAKVSYIDKVQLQNKEMKLKMWQNSLEEKAQMLQRRQMDLESTVNQLNSQKRQDDERLRKEERRIMELEMNYKRQIMNQKKQIADQKQKMSAEIGDLELDIIKRKQANQIQSRQNEIDKESLEKEREELRRMSFEVMQTHKANQEQLQQERQKISYIQLQLLKKLRVVELKAQETHLNRNNEEEELISVAYEAAQLKDKSRDWQPVRRISKESNTKSMSNLLKTKERFYDVQMNARSQLNTSVKDHKKLDLGHYISRIEHFSKVKQ